MLTAYKKCLMTCGLVTMTPDFLTSKVVSKLQVTGKATGLYNNAIDRANMLPPTRKAAYRCIMGSCVICNEVLDLDF